MSRSLNDERVVSVDGAEQRVAPHSVPVRIVIADESPIFRDGLRRLLETDARLAMIGETRPGPSAVTLACDTRPDILLLGPASAGCPWLDTLKAIGAAGIPVRTILLAKTIDMFEVTAALECGAFGVLARDSAAELIFKSIDIVMAGHYWIGDHLATHGVETSLRRLDQARRRALGFGLTRRELAIVRAVVNGETNKAVARRFAISENTVKRHLMHIYNKVGASNRVELALFAAHHRLLDAL